MDEYLVTNGSNSSIRIMADSAEEALRIGIEIFDANAEYILPICASDEWMDDCAGIYDF